MFSPLLDKHLNKGEKSGNNAAEGNTIKMNIPKFLNILLTPLNSIIIGATVIFSALSFTWYGDFSKPFLFGSIILIFSVLYSVFFSSAESSQENLNESEMHKLAHERNDNLTPVIEKIISSLQNIKEKSKNDSKFLIITKFMDEISTFEEMIPKLIKSYRSGSSFLRERRYQIQTEIQNIEYKLSSTTGIAKETYEKTLAEKQQTMNEMTAIQNSLDDCESKLHYILSTLQKIEAIIAASELNDVVSDEDAQNISQQLEVFSSSIKDVVKLMKI